jgi:transposase
MGPVTAGAFLGMIGDPKAYESSRQVLMMAGLNLVPNSSGTRRGTVKVSKRGRPLLRRVVYMFAMRHVREGDGMYRDRFERMVQVGKRPKKQAIVNLMRPALRMMFRVAREERPYTAEPPRD